MSTLAAAPVVQDRLYSARDLTVNSKFERLVTVLVELVIERRLQFSPDELAAAGINLDVWFAALLRLELIAD